MQRRRQIGGETETGLDIPGEIDHVRNPRVERKRHYYHARHMALLELGLQPTPLTDQVLTTTLGAVARHRERIDLDRMLPRIRWDPRPED